MNSNLTALDESNRFPQVHIGVHGFSLDDLNPNTSEMFNIVGNVLQSLTNSQPASGMSSFPAREPTLLILKRQIERNVVPIIQESGSRLLFRWIDEFCQGQVSGNSALRANAATSLRSVLQTMNLIAVSQYRGSSDRVPSEVMSQLNAVSQELSNALFNNFVQVLFIASPPKKKNLNKGESTFGGGGGGGGGG